MQNMVLIDAGNFFCAGLLRNAVQNIECGLYRPTDKKRGGDVIFRPLQHLFDLRPVGNIVKFNQTQRAPVTIRPSKFWSQISSKLQ
jgi:hypothetical protein